MTVLIPKMEFTMEHVFTANTEGPTQRLFVLSLSVLYDKRLLLLRRGRTVSGYKCYSLLSDWRKLNSGPYFISSRNIHFWCNFCITIKNICTFGVLLYVRKKLFDLRFDLLFDINVHWCEFVLLIELVLSMALAGSITVVVVKILFSSSLVIFTHICLDFINLAL